MDGTFGKTLVMSPHADDEVIGAFSFLNKNNIVEVISVNENKVCGKRPKMERRIKEIDNLSTHLKVLYRIGVVFDVNHYHHNINNIVNSIEEEINKFKPDTVLIPFPSFNQDHKTVYEACIIALRQHDKNHFVKKVLMYDVYDYTKWGEKQMEMNYFREVDIKKKVKAYALYRSQVRSYRSPKDLKRWAEEIGRRCNLKFAEGFRIIRFVE